MLLIRVCVVSSGAKSAWCGIGEGKLCRGCLLCSYGSVVLFEIQCQACAGGE